METFHSVKYLWSSSSVIVRKLLTSFTGSPSVIETYYNREDKSKNSICRLLGLSGLHD